MPAFRLLQGAAPRRRDPPRGAGRVGSPAGLLAGADRPAGGEGARSSTD